MADYNPTRLNDSSENRKNAISVAVCIYISGTANNVICLKQQIIW
jgi:hypothetical protein